MWTQQAKATRGLEDNNLRHYTTLYRAELHNNYVRYYLPVAQWHGFMTARADTPAFVLARQKATDDPYADCAEPIEIRISGKKVQAFRLEEETGVAVDRNDETLKRITFTQGIN